MADNLAVKDALAITRVVRTTENGGIHTPHHIVSGEVAIAPGSAPIEVEGSVSIDAPVAISNFPTDTASEATLVAVLTKLSADPASQTTLAAMLAKLSSDPASQTTLAAVLAKMSNDPASQTTLAAILAKLSDPASETTLLAMLERLPLALDHEGRLKVALPPAGAASTVEVTNFPTDAATEATLASILAKLPSSPASQTTLAAILAKLTADASTETTLAAVLAKLTADPATQSGLINILNKMSSDPASQTSMAQAADALGVLVARATNDPATQTTLAAILAKLTADPATQTTLAAILAKLANPATESTLASFAAKFPNALDAEGRLKVALPIAGAASIVEVSNFPTTGATEETLAAALTKLGDLSTQTTLASVLAKLPSDPATQTTLAAILTKLSADPATQTTLAAILTKLSADPATQTTLAAILTKLADPASQTTLSAVLDKLTADPATNAALATLTARLPSALDGDGRLKVALAGGGAASTVEVSNFPTTGASEVTLEAVLAALGTTLEVSGPQTDAQMRAAPVITSGYDPVFDKMVVGTARDKFREAFFNFDTTNAWEVISSGTGMTITQDGVLNGSRYLNIAAGTTANSETVILSRTSFQLPVKFAFALTMSQRIANQEVYAELVGVDENGNIETDTTYPAPNMATARNGTGFKFDSTVATTANTMVRGYGVSELTSALASQTTTVATGTSPNFLPAGYYQIEADMEQVYFSSYAIDSLAANLAPLRRTQSLPNPLKRYKIRLRVKNLSTAPASATNVRFHFLRLIDTTRMSVDFRQPGHATDVANAVPVVMTQAGPTQPVSGSVNATLAAGTAVAGSVGVSAVTTGVGAASLRIASTATTNIAVVKASAGKLYGGVLSNTTTSAKYVKFYNKATAAVPGTDVPVLTIVLQPNTTLPLSLASDIGMAFTAGIGIAITGAIADADTTAVAALDVVGNLLFI